MASPTLSCQRCGKRLSRKTARQINGEILCSPCMFGQRRKNVNVSKTVSRADARMIADAAVDLADKALHWKERALSAEEALRKFAGEIYGAQRKSGVTRTGGDNAVGSVAKP